MEDIVNTEFPQLKETLYLDYAGAMPTCRSQTEKLNKISQQCFANPHSSGQHSVPVSEMEDLRNIVCSHCSTNTGEYSVVFTQNATHAIQLFGSLFKWTPKTCFSYLFDNHNSIFGLRSVASKRGCHVECVYKIPEKVSTEQKDYDQHIFAFPMQSNFSGKKYPYKWISQHQKNGGFVIFDCAGATCPNLSKEKPDFVILSLLKLTGVHGGVFLIRRDREFLLEDPNPAGGTLIYSCARTGDFKLLPMIYQRLEMGTPSYIDLSLAIEGFRIREKLGNETEITNRILEISKYFEEKLTGLKHNNGKPLVKLAPERNSIQTKSQERKSNGGNSEEISSSDDECSFGGIFSFNLYSDKGILLSHYDIQFSFSVFQVVARFGGHCNPGAGFTALDWDPEEVKKIAYDNEQRGKCISNLCSISPRPLGTIRISFGASSTFNDADRIIKILSQQFLNGGPCPPIGSLIVPFHVSQMFVFPVLGCLGFEVKNWSVSNYGMKYDRVWKLVNPDGLTIPTTNCTRLMSLKASIEDDKYLVLNYRNEKEIKVLINNYHVNEQVPEKVKKEGEPYGPEVSEFLVQTIGRYLFLVKTKHREEGRMAFSAITKESLAELENDFDPLRFRVNLVLEGAPAFSEEGKVEKNLQIDGIKITKWRHRIICMTTSINPKDGKILLDPLKKLTEKRGRNGAVTFGVLFAVDCDGKTHQLQVGAQIRYST
ncbi:MOSC N-terminal beta barrel domain containing protein [Tritrichomonas foetus]|uniref:MOSC N-terminal beta barrel domain containing protein n=1 Tax=Tritrichomonas foetus TaxID=1144522 RepID=A0A1J4J8Q5_9EUKA|nr:MOSC N-terminal beta barrel domain containing protein [Tritrichomonas foetus]|eukprot:OHS95073.1 MOSC N-terminal beta barrel domain containing protein [Tritrichomonas foetus]